MNIKLMLGGEPHTVEWRHFMLEKLGLSKNDLTGVMDYYGTSDSGGPGASTPLTALIQNLCLKDNLLCKYLFKQSIVPSLFQQNPTLYVECVEGKIIVSYPGQLPLCRYDSGDTGGLLKFSEVMDVLKKFGYDINYLMKENGYKDLYWKWPFIYLTGRTDLAVNIGGALVYPNDIEGLFFQNKAREINSFKLAVESDKYQKLKLIVYLELKPNTTFTNLKVKEKEYKNMILNRLLKVNEDFAAAYEMDKELCEPDIVICNFQEVPFENEHKRPKPLFIRN